MPRAILLVLDSFGIGEAPDAARFGDQGADTLGHIAEACANGQVDNDQRSGPLNLPNLARLGLFHAHAEATGQCAAGITLPDSPTGAWGHAAELSTGKDTPSGHWEMAGVPVRTDFGYFDARENSFPAELLDKLIEQTGLPGLLGNCHASGTDIIQRLGEEHLASGKPIVYTSADSVFQIAAHETSFGLDRLYAVCEKTRELLMPFNIGRVIARPFTGSADAGFRRTGNRRDYSLSPPAPTVLDKLVDAGGEVLAVGKIADIFAHRGISRHFKAGDNAALFDATLEAIAATDHQVDERTLVFSNFVDFDMDYGHRRDVAGYARALEDFDRRLPELLAKLEPDDLLILSADHGCDPTFPGSDHTREFVPVLALGAGLEPGSLGRRATFADIGQTLAGFFELDAMDDGESFLPLNKALVNQLLQLRERAYVPYSRHPVAVIARGLSGSLHGGCNVETAHYKSTCAEASALSAMVAAGERELTELYILGPTDQPCAPCGDCRQRIVEFAAPGCRVHLVGASGKRLRSYSVDQLLPDAFTPRNLK